MKTTLLALTSASALLLACASSSEPATEVARDALEERVIETAPGPTRLRGSCTAGGETLPFDADVAQPAHVYVGIESTNVGTFMATVDVSVAPVKGVFLASFRSIRARLWEAEGVTSKEVSHVLALGATMTFEDASLLTDRPVSCSGTLVKQPTSHVVASGGPIGPLVALVAPRLEVDVVMPGRLACGIALSFATPLAPTALDDFRRAFEVGSTDVALEGDRRIVVRVPAAPVWDAFLDVESRDHATPIADALRTALRLRPAPAALGTLETLECPAK